MWPKRVRANKRGFWKMLDVLMRVSVENIRNAVIEVETDDGVEYEGAIPCLEELTDVPLRLCVCVDGGTEEDIALLRRYLPASSCEWTLMQNDGVLGYERTMAELSKVVKNDFVAVVPAGIWVDDPQWFGKMQVVFTKDPHCFMVAADVPNTVAATVPPIRLDHKTHPESGFFMTRAPALLNVNTFTCSADFSRRAHQMGGTRWVASGVRYGEAPHAREKTGTV
jgi:hypothetical protein